MNIYIRSSACISPNSGPEPDYKTLLDPKLIRRMSRIVRMGAAAGVTCLKAADIAVPDAIVTGTAYGCLEDTGLFLNSLIERNEEMLQPGPFIQSTHNTVGAQIALLLQCTGYNNTFVHRGLSFESALLDGALLLEEEEADNVLVGGIDEITDASHTLLTRFGLYRNGATAGEGAAFFLLTDQPGDNDYACLKGIATCYKPAGLTEIEQWIGSFLDDHDLDPTDPALDLVMMGNNGDEKNDAIYRHLSTSVFNGKTCGTWKQLSGEYPTAAAFALWQAAELIRSGAHRRILIYNHYLGIHHSLLLLS